ncbi:reelin domain-containing protein 1-like [Dysidea avara]|uniref:reelin domain-containing protein 1-like n=1 Tax=Dysidea avara TaxID=196820 RepID=UPI0033258C1F
MAKYLVQCLVVSLLLVTTAHGRPEGAPPEACAQIAPMHAGISPSTDPLPYSVDLSDFTGDEYVPGDTYQITLSGGADNPNFRGFLIQGRVAADGSPTGQFTGSAGVSQPQCDGDTAVTHVNNNEKTSVTVMWTAPAAGTGAVIFRFAFVDMFVLFWANMETSAIQEAAPPTTEPTTEPPTDPTTEPPTDPTTEPPTDPTTEPPTDPGPTQPPNCGDITGLPECTEKLCRRRSGSYGYRFQRCYVVKDSCGNRCQISNCLKCYYERVRVKQPTRPRCEPCGKRSDRQCWYKYYQCRYKYSGYSRHQYSYKRVFKCTTRFRCH